MPLSEAVQDLIRKARIVSFAAWQSSHPAAAIEIFQAADDKHQYLSDPELATLAEIVPDRTQLLAVATLLRNHAAEIVDDARSGILQQFPGITEAGGALYPAERANACWRDFWEFLRCITYGIAGQHQQYTSDQGLEYMRQLYQELDVPLDAMIAGIEGVKIASLKRVFIHHKQSLDLAPYFDHLIDRLDRFRSVG